MPRFKDMTTNDVFDFVEGKLRAGFKRALSKNHGLKKGRTPLSDQMMCCGPFFFPAEFECFVSDFHKNFASGICPAIAPVRSLGMSHMQRDIDIGGSVFSIVMRNYMRDVSASVMWIEVGDENPWEVPPVISG